MSFSPISGAAPHCMVKRVTDKMDEDTEVYLRCRGSSLDAVRGLLGGLSKNLVNKGLLSLVLR